MENNKSKVAIVGAGRMGITHYSILNAHPDVEVVAVVDPMAAMSALFEKYMHVRTYKNHATMFDREELDAVILCTPPSLNYQILLEACAKGIHAFVEKPGTLMSVQALEIARLFEERNLVNQVGYVNRFNDVFVALKGMLEDDLVGVPIRIDSSMYSRTIIREEKVSGWRSSREQGGGAVYEMASHAIDLVNYLCGKPIAVTGSRLTRVYSKQVEDVVSSTFLYPTSCVGSLSVNWSDKSYRKPTNKLEIFGRRGRVLADQHGVKVYLGAENPKWGFREGWNSRTITDLFSPVPFFVRGNEFTAQLYHFIDCIRSPRESTCRCTFREAADALEVIERIFRDDAEVAKLVGV